MPDFGSFRAEARLMGIQWLAHVTCDFCGSPTTAQVNLETGKDMNVSYPEGWVVEQPEAVTETVGSVTMTKWPIKVWCPDHVDPDKRRLPG